MSAAFGQIVPEGHILVGETRYVLGRDADGKLRYQVGFSKEWRYANSMPLDVQKAAIKQNHPLVQQAETSDISAQIEWLRNNTDVFTDEVHQVPARLKIDQKLVTTWAEEARR